MKLKYPKKLLVSAITVFSSPVMTQNTHPLTVLKAVKQHLTERLTQLAEKNKRNGDITMPHP